MLRTRGTRGVAVLSTVGTVAVLAGVMTPSYADGETCHGQPATIVGGRGVQIEGTDGPDVVVTNGSTEVDTGAGDDLVCVTGDGDDVEVFSGDGDDLVDTTDDTGLGGTFVLLGEGDDTFVGGRKGDHVIAAERELTSQGMGRDTVSTGGGADLVETGGSPSDPDHDAVDLGAGRDMLWVKGPMDADRLLDGGAGKDQLELEFDVFRTELVLDNARGRATHEGTPVMSWAGMERFRLSASRRFEPPSFIGGRGAERVQSYVPLKRLDLGGGDDVVDLELQDELVDHASYRGGAGDDGFVIYSGAGDMARRARLDLPRHSLLFQRQSETVRARISGFERHRLSADRLDVRGTRRADRIEFNGCDGVVDGGPGDDLITMRSVADAGCGYLGEDNHLEVRGGDGDDRLVGGYMPDVLVGGPGRDAAYGGANRDRCVAEREVTCEL